MLDVYLQTNNMIWFKKKKTSEMAAFPVNHKNHMMGIHKEKQREIKNSWYIKKKKTLAKEIWNCDAWQTDWGQRAEFI